MKPEIGKEMSCEIMNFNGCKKILQKKSNIIYAAI